MAPEMMRPHKSSESKKAKLKAKVQTSAKADMYSLGVQTVARCY